MLPRTEPTCRKQEHNYEYHKRTTHKRRHRDRRTGRRIGRQKERAWLKSRQDVGNGRNGTDEVLAKQRHKTHTQRHTAVARTKGERERERWQKRGRERGRQTKIGPSLGLLTDAAPSVIVFCALFHCLVATVIVFYCMGGQRGGQGNEGGRRRGNCAGNAMLESVLTRRSLRHFIKSGHGTVQFSTHFLCTASRATSFPSFPYPLLFSSL